MHSTTQNLDQLQHLTNLTSIPNMSLHQTLLYITWHVHFPSIELYGCALHT
jgi:hypothetical protein